MVCTTVALSAVVVVLLGFFLMQQIQSSLLHAKEQRAFIEAQAGRSAAKSQLDGSQAADPRSRAAALNELATILAERGGPTDLYDVVIRGGPRRGEGTSSVRGRATGRILPASVPQRLAEAVRNERAGSGVRQRYTYARLSYAGDRGAKPGLVVGAPVGPYELYYLFPLEQETETLATVRRTVMGAGAALVLLLAAVAYLVTRQVVTPVRAAAGTAERLASGQLDRRMQVRGEDDLARLATSFNKMAGNLQDHIHQLEELSRVQRRFVSDVSHELRTPLSTVRMAADVVHEERGSFDPMVARSAELLQAQLERFEVLLTDLLEISRHDAGAAVLDAESVDLRDLVVRALGDTRGLAARTSTPVVQRLPDEPCPAEVDRRRVERILRNLSANAVEYGQGREVIVTAACGPDAVAVTVRDHGVGLDPGADERVFDRFWRADPARARTTGGTGLGLSISSEDAALHGGWLQAWGRPGQGSQFRLSLPRAAGAELQESPLPLVPPDLQGEAPPAVGPGSGSASGADGEHDEPTDRVTHG